METKRFKIEDVILDISMGPFGSDIKKEVYTDSGVPVLNGSNLQGFELVEDSFGYVTEEKADSLKKANAHRGDIVITHRGTIGQIVYIPQNSKFERYVISQSQFRVTCNKDIVLPEYLTYYFHTREGQYKLLSNASQVGVPALARASTTFRKLEIDLPSIEIQRKAIDIILELQQKIAVNRRICANLEAQAQALFKHWFIDFAPFKDGKFVESELGMIPEGWRVGSPYEYLDFIYGAPYKSNLFNDKKEGLPLIRIRDLKDCSPQFYTPEVLPKSEYVKAGDILAGMDAEFAPYIWKGQQGLLNQRVCKIKPKSKEIGRFFCMLLVKPQLLFVQAVKTGTTVSHIGKSDIDRFKVILPPLNEVIRFSKLGEEILDEIITVSAESSRLSTLRDTLLPKLMSGEIKV